MTTSPCKGEVLLIEDDKSYAELVQTRFLQEKDPTFDYQWVGTLEMGLKFLARNQVDIILLDLSLPDSSGLETLIKLSAQVPKVPVLIMTGLNDETLAVEAVRRGAQDVTVMRTGGDVVTEFAEFLDAGPHGGAADAQPLGEIGARGAAFTRLANGGQDYGVG